MELVYNEETKEWEQKKEPFITIEVETEEDFEFIGNAIAFYKKHMDEQARPQTNADRIRAMSDEELAEYFAEIGNDASNGISYSENPEEWLEWLKQPAEDE